MTRLLQKLVIGLVLTTVCGTASAFGQVVDKGWYCPADKMSGSCNGKADCDAAWDAHMARYHGGSSTTTGNDGSSLLPALAIAAAAPAGVAWWASNRSNPGDTVRNNYAAQAGGGFGLALGGVYAGVASKSPAAGAVVTGLGTYWGTRSLLKKRELDGNQDPASTEKTSAIMGGTAAAATYVGLATANMIAPGLHFPKGMTVSAGRRHIWMRWLW